MDTPKRRNYLAHVILPALGISLFLNRGSKDSLNFQDAAVEALSNGHAKKCLNAAAQKYVPYRVGEAHYENVTCFISEKVTVVAVNKPDTTFELGRIQKDYTGEISATESNQALIKAGKNTITLSSTVVEAYKALFQDATELLKTSKGYVLKVPQKQQQPISPAPLGPR